MAKAKKVLVFGGSGQLGSQIVRLWADIEVLAPPRSEVDIEDAAAIARAIQESGPDAVVNCTAFNDVPRAEKEPDRAFAINALAVDRMAEICAMQACTFVTFSTDYVFDGSLGRPYVETDEPHPLNAYGASKLEGERRILRRESGAYVLRTCGVFGTSVSRSKGYTFIHKIIDLARAGKPLRIVTDQTISPTYAGSLAVAVRALIDSDAPYGLYHAANEGVASWYEFAREALQQAGIDRTIEPISSDELGAAVQRPKYSALENAKLHHLGMALPTWQQGVAAFLVATR